jgi:cell division ATPase FtsA
VGRRKGTGNHSSQKNNLTKDSDGNEDNRYPVPDPNKTKINDTKESSNDHNNILKEEIQQVITDNFMEKIVDMVNQNLQDALKKSQVTKNKEHENT